VKCDVESRQPQQWLQKARDTIRNHARAFIAAGWIADESEMASKLNWRIESIARQMEHAFAGTCPACDEPFAKMSTGRAALTVDVCDPTRPPVWSLNTRLCCTTCNKEKHKAGLLETARLELAKCIPETVAATNGNQLTLFGGAA
jgi:hypothetical protein